MFSEDNGKKGMTLLEAFDIAGSIVNNEDKGICQLTDGDIRFYLEMFGWSASDTHVKRVRKMANQSPPSPGKYKRSSRSN